MSNLKRFVAFPKQDPERSTLAWWFLGNLEPRKSKVDAAVVVGSYVVSVWYTYRSLKKAHALIQEIRQDRKTYRLNSTYEEMGPSGDYGWTDTGEHNPALDIEVPLTVTQVEWVRRPGVSYGAGPHEPKFDLVYDDSGSGSGRIGIASEYEYSSLQENEFIGLSVDHARQLFQQRCAALYEMPR